MSPRGCASIVLCIGALACMPDQPIRPSARRSAIKSGDPVDASFQAIVRIQAGATTCTGTLLTNRWLLTAAHCVSASVADPGSVEVFFGGTRAAPAQRAVATEIVRSSAALNLALVRLEGNILVSATQPSFLRRPYPVTASSLVGRTVGCVGWGSDGLLPAPDQANWASLMVASATGPLVRLRTNARGQEMAAGDAGGGCFADLGPGNYPVAVMVGTDGTGDTVAVDLTKAEVRTWLEGSMTAREPDIAGDAASPPAALVNDQGGVTLFWVDQLGALSMKPDSGPDPETSFGSPDGDPFSPSTPAAALVNGELHVIARAESGVLYERVRTVGGVDGRWHSISDADIAAASLGVAMQPGRFDVFALSDKRTVRQATFSGGHWTPWQDLTGGFFDLGVTAVVFEYARIDIFPVGNGQTYHSWSQYDVWPGGWATEVDGEVASAIALVTTGATGFDMFIRNPAGHLAHRWYNYSWLDAWIDVGLAIPGPPAAVIAGTAIHLYARNPDGSIWHVHMPR